LKDDYFAFEKSQEIWFTQPPGKHNLNPHLLIFVKTIFMGLRLGDTAPDFTAETTKGTIRFHEYLGESWGVLFSHPADFTPVCTTELGRTAQLRHEFDRRNVKVLALSVDSAESHRKWITDINAIGQTELYFPIIADPDKTVAELYDMIHPNASETFTVRSLFIVGPDRKIKLTITYPASTGRNFDEVLRVIDSLQLTARHSVLTPANWKPGEEVIVAPALSDEEATHRFPSGIRAARPYLRYTDQPGY
jgi:alkyl hydroperoxide reductase subunit AhpC